MRASTFALLLFVAGAAACGGGHELHLTIEIDPAVTADDVTAIRTLEIAVFGAEPSDVRYTLGAILGDRKTTWIYKAKADGALKFEITARGDARKLIASGKSKLLTPSGSAVTDTVVLTASAPTPNKRRLGASCTVGVDVCASGFCVDGVCCDSACEGTCNTCNKGPVAGVCAVAAVGTNPRKACTVDAANPCGLDGTCDGAGSCRTTPKGKVCATPTCAAGILTVTALCDGAGTCGTPATRDCTPYACNPTNTGCATICTAAAGCKIGVTCVAGGCGKVGLGGRCFGGNDCQAGLCIDGFCCDVACAGQCKSCKEVGQEGTCVDVAAGNDDAHKVCKDGGSTMCGNNGKCDGTGGCQNYPKGTACAPGGCAVDKSAVLTPSFCTGDGSACPTVASTSCGPYRCSTDGAPGCDESCGECTYYESGKAPPFADRCADGLSCVDHCLEADASFVCQ